MTKERPLWHKLYFDPVYVEVAQAIGYLGFQYRELYERMEPLYKKFGKGPVESAVYHLATFEGQMTVNPKPLAKVELRAHVRKLCKGLLGPPPEEWDAFYANVTDPPPNRYKERAPGQPKERPLERPKPEAPPSNGKPKDEAGLSPDTYAKKAREANKRQLHCMLRDARKKLKHHGKRSFAGKEAKKALTAVEREFVERSLVIPVEGEETLAWDKKK